MDSMPHLSDDTIRHIFSFLPLEQVFKASTLCTRFRNPWPSIPHLILDQYEVNSKRWSNLVKGVDRYGVKTSILCTRFRNPWPFIPNLILDQYDYRLDLKRWTNLVRGVCASIQNHGDSIRLQKFTFRLSFFPDASGLRDAYNELLSFAFSHGLQEIHIDIPPPVSMFADFLLKGCSALAGSLTTLKLRSGAMEILPSFLSCCPCLENVDASSSFITEDVRFVSRKLKSLKLRIGSNLSIGGNITRVMVEIMAPNLELLHYYVEGDFSCELLPIDTCTSLRELIIYQVGFPSGWLERCIPKLNSLQVLKFFTRPSIPYMIHSDTLVELHLSHPCDDLSVNAPKLHYLKIEDVAEQHLNFTACPNIQKLELEYCVDDNLELCLSKFPNIQHLKLDVPGYPWGFPKFQKICIRHAQLKTLDLLNGKDMLVELDTPMLQTFKYNCFVGCLQSSFLSHNELSLWGFYGKLMSYYSLRIRNPNDLVLEFYTRRSYQPYISRKIQLADLKKAMVSEIFPPN